MKLKEINLMERIKTFTLRSINQIEFLYFFFFSQVPAEEEDKTAKKEEEGKTDEKKEGEKEEKAENKTDKATNETVDGNGKENKTDAEIKVGTFQENQEYLVAIAEYEFLPVIKFPLNIYIMVNVDHQH